MGFKIIFHIQISQTMVDDINANAALPTTLIKRFEYGSRGGVIELIDSATMAQAQNLQNTFRDRLIEIIS